MGSSQATTVNLALFGLGRMGMIHLENIVKHPQVNVAYIVEFDVEKAEKAKRDYNLKSVKIVHSGNDAVVFEDVSVDGILVSSPTDIHEGLIMKGIAAGGIFHDCAVHDLDLMRWMIGEEPETVFSIAHAHIPEIADLNDADTVYIVLKFPSGVIGHIDLSRDCKYGYHQTCEIFGENGSLMSDNPLKSAVNFNGVGGMLCDVLHNSFKQRYREAYMEEIDHFVQLLTDKTKQCIVKPSDTIRATFLAQACEDSWRTGQVINLKTYSDSLFKDYNLDSLDQA